MFLNDIIINKIIFTFLTIALINPKVESTTLRAIIDRLHRAEILRGVTVRVQLLINR
jgi:hypothetical protein